MDKKPLVVIAGPTAVGKTKVSIILAQMMQGEIISADSMLIYRNMDIGTARPSYEERENIPHHLIDILDPSQQFSVAQYQKMTLNIINEIHARNRLPIIVGGTGLYINSIIYPMNFTTAGFNPELRSNLLKDIEKYGSEYLFDRLKNIDPIKAEAINPNDTKRIVRALEVFQLTGKPMSVYSQDNYKNEPTFQLAIVGLNMERSILYQRIDQRVDEMFDEGLVEEVYTLKKLGCNVDMQSMQGLGYKQVLEYLEGRMSLSDTINLVKQNTRRYAKRQLTWFRRDKRIYWINTDDFSTAEVLAETIASYAKGIFTLKQEGYSI